MRLLICGMLIAFTPVLSALSMGQETPSATQRMTDDAYLIGLLGVSHVVVLHNYVSLLAERSRDDVNPQRTLARLETVRRHCDHLVAQFGKRPRIEGGAVDDVPAAHLTDLLNLVREETIALKSAIETPGRERNAAFRMAQEALESRLELLRPTDSDDGADDENEVM